MGGQQQARQEAGRDPGRVSRDAERLGELKREIAIDAYEVDPKEIAEAMLRKLRLVRSARLALAGGDDDRTPRPGPPAPRFH